MSEEILLVTQHQQVRILTLNRPQRLNAFNEELTFKLQESLKEAEKDVHTRCLIITGSGRGFCAGQDLQDRMVQSSDRQLPSLGESIRKRYNPIITRLRRMEKPVIAAVNGVAAGAGASLALACDLRIVADSAVFIQSFSRVGLVPDSGSSFLLPRLLGVTKALELMLTANQFTAAEALQWGLVNQVVPDDQVANVALALAEQLSRGPTKAFGLTKRTVNRAMFTDLEELLDYEADLQEIAGRSQDFQEGVQAFMQKREPVYSGK